MNILLIEDNKSIIKGLKYSLEQNNYIVNFESGYIDAYKYINSDNKIDLIILDVTLLDGNGFSLYENIIKDKKIPTIFLTACDEEDDIVKGLELGAEDYLTKPFSTKELLVRIKKILNKKDNNIILVKDVSYDVDKMIL